MHALGAIPICYMGNKEYSDLPATGICMLMHSSTTVLTNSHAPHLRAVISYVKQEMMVHSMPDTNSCCSIWTLVESAAVAPRV